MNYIKTNINNKIEIISQIPINDHTCIVETLPNDFYKYIANSKYLANEEGLYIRENWFEYDFIVIIPIILQVESFKSKALQTGDKYDILGQLIDSLYINLIQKVKINELEILVYLEQILPEHRQIIELFNEIEIIEL